MKNAYPIILKPDKVGFVVYIPDFDINTEGDTKAEAMEMARDAIGLLGIELENQKKPVPSPSDFTDISVKNGDIITLVDVDFQKYRHDHDMRAVKKNCTIPSWLCSKAEKANINFSQVLQAALKRELNISDRQ